MSQTYVLNIYTRRHQATDDYTLTHTPTGWELTGPAHGGECDFYGTPYVFESLNEDNVHYPESLEDTLKQLWNLVETQTMTHKEIQNEFNALSQWLKTIETSVPTTDFWNKFFS